MNEGAIKLWEEKLAKLLEAEAVETDPAELFKLEKQIKRARTKRAELEGLPQKVGTTIIAGTKLGHVIHIDRRIQWNELIVWATTQSTSQFLVFPGQACQNLPAFKKRIISSLAHKTQAEIRISTTAFYVNGTRHGPKTGGDWVCNMVETIEGHGPPATRLRTVSDQARSILIVEAPAPQANGDHVDALFEELMMVGKALLDKGTSRHPILILLLLSYDETSDMQFTSRLRRYAKSNRAPLRIVDEFRYPSWDEIEDYLDTESPHRSIPPTKKAKVRRYHRERAPDFRAFLAETHQILNDEPL